MDASPPHPTSSHYPHAMYEHTGQGLFDVKSTMPQCVNPKKKKKKKMGSQKDCKEEERWAGRDVHKNTF